MNEHDASPVYPLTLEGEIDEPSRWLWLIKPLLAFPHLVVLLALWLAAIVLTVVAFFAILLTGRYPRRIFAFNTGVLRWTWRVAFYTYSAMGTDFYPPFTLADVPSYPAWLEIAQPRRLSRGLVLGKWVLALPHYVVVAVFVDGASAGFRVAGDLGGWTPGGGLIGLLALIAGIVLLFTGRYPRSIFDFIMGMNRWVFRVVAYTLLMTDAYPPFRLDLGGYEPARDAASNDALRPGPLASDPLGL